MTRSRPIKRRAFLTHLLAGAALSPLASARAQESSESVILERSAVGTPHTRPVYFGQGQAITAHIYERASLAPGFKGDGPALIEEYGSTTLIWPGDRFDVGVLGEIHIACGRG